MAFGNNYMATATSLRLFISSKERDPVNVTVESLIGFSFTGIATNDRTLTVEIPTTFQVLSNSERNKGLSITAEGRSNIAVYGINYHVYTSDAFLALPCNRLPVDQYEYYGLSYNDGSPGLNYILMVGCEDGTVVQLGSESIVLNRMETYFFEANYDITGTRLVSNQPLVVYSGSTCTFIPSNVRACDHITEQVPPTIVWGRNFLSASFANRSSGDIYRILTSKNSTTVTVNCSTFTEPSTYFLGSPGSWQEFSTLNMSFCSIISDKPLLVMQFGLSYSLDYTGDPFMMMIIPIEQYSNNYVFNPLPEFSKNFLTLLVAPKDYQPQNIIVDDTSLVNADWAEVFCSDTTICGYITYVTLTPGVHQVHHTDTSASVGVCAYGFNLTNSYGYPGGLRLENLNCKSHIHYITCSRKINCM